MNRTRRIERYTECTEHSQQRDVLKKTREYERGPPLAAPICTAIDGPLQSIPSTMQGCYKCQATQVSIDLFVLEATNTRIKHLRNLPQMAQLDERCSGILVSKTTSILFLKDNKKYYIYLLTTKVKKIIFHQQHHKTISPPISTKKHLFIWQPYTM